jgi:hypothetical protein
MPKKTDPISAATYYREALARIVKAGSLATAVKEARDALDITFDPPYLDTLTITAGYGKKREGFVTIATTSPAMQCSIAEARHIAGLLERNASIAEVEALMMRFFEDKTDVDRGEAEKLLAVFRQYRNEDKDKGKKPPTA